MLCYWCFLGLFISKSLALQLLHSSPFFSKVVCSLFSLFTNPCSLASTSIHLVFFDRGKRPDFNARGLGVLVDLLKFYKFSVRSISVASYHGVFGSV